MPQMASGPGIGGDAPPKNKWAGIFLASFAAFAGVLYGYDTGNISSIKTMSNWLSIFGTPDGKGGFTLSSSNESLVVSILSAGTFFGALLGAPVGDFVGRKGGIFVALALFSLGVACQTGAHNWATFIVGRVFAGLGVGLISTMIPMYQSECAPKWIRGAVVSAYQWAITIGILLANVITNATHLRTDKASWQIPVAVQFVFAAFLAFGMLFLPESPRWLIKKGKEAKAAHALSRLTGHSAEGPEVTTELNDIRANLRAEEDIGESSWIDCFKIGEPNRIALRIWTGIGLQAFQQLTGINFIFYFGTGFFQAAGIPNPFIISVATSIVNVFSTLPGMWGVERFGRRRLLIWGAAGMCVCEFIVAIVGVTVSTHNVSGQKVLVAFVCIYIFFFASTWGPIAWVVIGEIYPLNVRAKGVALSCASNWLWNFAIAYATPYLVNSGPGNANLGVKVFFLWGSTCFCCILYAYLLVPETKGLSLEQVDIMYQNTTPLRSERYRRELLARDVHAADTGAVNELKQNVEHESIEEKA